MMGTRGLVFYLLSGFSVAVFSLFLVTDYQKTHQKFESIHLFSVNSAVSGTEKVWPVSFLHV